MSGSPSGAGQGALPSFQELMWDDLFGEVYVEGLSSLFVRDEDGDGIYDVLAQSATQPDFSDYAIPVVGALAFEYTRELVEFPPPTQIVDGLAEPDPYYATASLDQAVFVATLTGVTGTSYIVTGILNGVELDFNIPADGGVWRIEQIVAMHRHLSVDQALELALDYLPEGPLPAPPSGTPSDPGEQDECDSAYDLCISLAKNDYDTERDNQGTPWVGIGVGSGAGAVVGTGIGTAVGAKTGPGVVVVAAVGGAFGAIVGAITGGIVDYTETKDQIDRRRKSRIDRCDIIYANCLDSNPA